MKGSKADKFSCNALWSAVISRAMNDLKSSSKHTRIEAKEYFNSKDFYYVSKLAGLNITELDIQKFIS